MLFKALRAKAGFRPRGALETSGPRGPHWREIFLAKTFLVEESLRRLVVHARTRPQYSGSMIEGLFDEIADGVVDFCVGLVARFRLLRA